MGNIASTDGKDLFADRLPVLQEERNDKLEDEIAERQPDGDHHEEQVVHILVLPVDLGDGREREICFIRCRHAPVTRLVVLEFIEHIIQRGGLAVYCNGIARILFVLGGIGKAVVLGDLLGPLLAVVLPCAVILPRTILLGVVVAHERDEEHEANRKNG